MMAGMRTGLLMPWRIADNGDMTRLRSNHLPNPTAPITDNHNRWRFTTCFTSILQKWRILRFRHLCNTGSSLEHWFFYLFLFFFVIAFRSCYTQILWFKLSVFFWVFFSFSYICDCFVKCFSFDLWITWLHLCESRLFHSHIFHHILSPWVKMQKRLSIILFRLHQTIDFGV